MECIVVNPFEVGRRSLAALNVGLLVRLALDEQLETRWIAERVGVSSSTAVRMLKRVGVRKRKGRWIRERGSRARA